MLNPSYNEGNIEGADFNEAVNCIKETRLTKADDSKMGSFNVDMQLQTPQSGTYTALINYYNAGSFASVSVEFIADEEFKGVIIFAGKGERGFRRLKAVNVRSGCENAGH